jgi:hypothetical protein
LDTHALLWFLDDDPQLVPTAKSLIEDQANRKHVSVATCWEIAIKAGLKKLDLGEPAITFLTRELATNRFELLGIPQATEGGSRRLFLVNSCFRVRFDAEPASPLKRQSIDPSPETARWTPIQSRIRPTRP